MIWDYHLMQTVQRRHTSLVVTEEAVRRGGEGVIPAVRNKLARKLQDDLRKMFDVETDYRDYGYRVDEESHQHVVSYRYSCAWRPTHGRVVLLGGPRDGEEMVVEPPMIGGPLVFPQLAMPVEFWQADSVEPLVTRNLEYRLGGWNERLRSFVYRYYI